MGTSMCTEPAEHGCSAERAERTFSHVPVRSNASFSWQYRLVPPPQQLGASEHSSFSLAHLQQHKQKVFKWFKGILPAKTRTPVSPKVG